jgi:hypothetical protein
MIRSFNISVIILFSLLLFSCRSSKVATTSPGTDGTTESYIRKYSDIAVDEMRRTGIPASITLAQGIIESDMGRSRLAREANNHFGIKCHNGWTGPTVRHHDDRKNECFRKYSNAEESYRDHSDFLVNGSRYDFLFELASDDYKGWAKGLKKAGYATNPDYANMLIRKIDEYDLHRYDSKNYKSEVVTPVAQPLQADSAVALPDGKPVAVRTGVRSLPERVLVNNKVQYIIVKESDTRESLEKELKLLSWELEKYNELPSDFGLTAGQILYLQPKRDRAEAGKEYHTVKEGETMYGISQLYAIKVSKLYYLNNMKSGKQPEAGERLWLRSVKPVE